MSHASHISWQEWCEWTTVEEGESVRDIEQDMAALVHDFQKCRTLVDKMKKWLHFHQIQEYGNFCANPHKNARIYSECLRDVLILLERIESRR